MILERPSRSSIVALGEHRTGNREITDLLKKEDTLLRRLTQNSVYKQTDYLAFQVTLQQQLLAYSELEIQFQYDLATLNYLAGIQDTALVTLADPELKLLAFPDYSNSPFYHQYVLDSLKLRNDRSMIDINYRPKFNLFADGGYNSSLQFDPYKNFGFSFGFSVAVPIYDGRKRNFSMLKSTSRKEPDRRKEISSLINSTNNSTCYNDNWHPRNNLLTRSTNK
jgi:hypothetical protein